MKWKMKAQKSLFLLTLCLLMAVTGCGRRPQDEGGTVVLNIGMQSEKEGQSAETKWIMAICAEAYRDAACTDAENCLEIMQDVITRLGAEGYAAVDSENQINMTNADQVRVFCSAVDAGKNAELTVIEVIDTGYAAAFEFRKYDFHTTDGRVDIDREYCCLDAQGNSVRGDSVSYPAEVWNYTEEGYLVFAGSYFADDYFIISLEDAPEYTALRVEPLDADCRELSRKYIQPLGYEDNNLFLVNWSEDNAGELDFYDLFDRFYPMFYQQTTPYTASQNPGAGAVYQIAEKEFERVIGAYTDIDPDTLRSNTIYFPGNKTYEYKPRGLYEIGCTNRPYPEVVSCTENNDNTITLLVNAVFPYECTSKAFSHEVVIRTLEDGSFRYVSNRIVEGDYDAWWYTARLTAEEWEDIYAGYDTIEEHENQNEAETDGTLWYLPQAADCLITKAEQEALQEQALAAAGQASEVYRNMEIEDGASYASNVIGFDSTRCKKVVSLLGDAGFVSVTEDADMENYQKLESFYAKYENGQDAMVTVYEVNRDGLIGAVTLIYKNMEQKDALQIYFVGVGWKEGGVPTIKNTLVSDVAEIRLTEKGYFLYTYADQIVHSDACQYWRIKPLSEQCRELTGKYVAGVSFVNYSAFVTDWDSSNAEDILMPCMFEDIYRMATGENLWTGGDQIPAELYERIMMTYFPVSSDRLRSKCGYDADSDSYPYEMIFATPYAPFGEVVDYSENPDGTVTLIVDGVWIDYGTDHAFTNEIVVKPFADGTFQYLSNRLLAGDWEVPQADLRR